MYIIGFFVIMAILMIFMLALAFSAGRDFERSHPSGTKLFDKKELIAKHDKTMVE